MYPQLDNVTQISQLDWVFDFVEEFSNFYKTVLLSFGSEYLTLVIFELSS